LIFVIPSVTLKKNKEIEDGEECYDNHLIRTKKIMTYLNSYLNIILILTIWQQSINTSMNMIKLNRWKGIHNCGNTSTIIIIQHQFNIIIYYQFMGGFQRFPWPAFINNAPFYYNPKYKTSMGLTVFAYSLNIMIAWRYASFHRVIHTYNLDGKPRIRQLHRSWAFTSSNSH